MFASHWYQSWRRVSFLQHNAALHLPTITVRGGLRRSCKFVCSAAPSP
jgi:hypothetical protein